MIIKKNHRLFSFCWLASSYNKIRTTGGGVSSFYEPESIEELQVLCKEFYAKGENFDLVGHTSNTLYLPDYCVERMISTRKLTAFEIGDDTIICEGGVSVRKLAKVAVEAGVKGFEGLVDLPGTVAAAICGNASCYGCSISNLLVSALVLTGDGQVLTVDSEWFAFTKRSSALKRGEKKAVILSLTLRKEFGEREELACKAEVNHNTRKRTQPAPQGTLGSIFADEGRPTLLNYTIISITKVYSLLLKVVGAKDIGQKRKHLTFRLLNATDVEPYVHHWNCYYWADERAHELFWKYVRLHKLMFTKSEFEIHIKAKA